MFVIFLTCQVFPYKRINVNKYSAAKASIPIIFSIKVFVLLILHDEVTKIG